jgi:hypothetical protein
MLDPVLVGEAEIARQIGAHRIGIEHHHVQERRNRIGERGLAGTRQTHNENFSMHAVPHEYASWRAV